MTIVCATDFSLRARPALDVATLLAHKFAEPLHLAHTLELSDAECERASAIVISSPLEPSTEWPHTGARTVLERAMMPLIFSSRGRAREDSLRRLLAETRCSIASLPTLWACAYERTPAPRTVRQQLSQNSR